MRVVTQSRGGQSRSLSVGLNTCIVLHGYTIYYRACCTIRGVGLGVTESTVADTGPWNWNWKEMSVTVKFLPSYSLTVTCCSQCRESKLLMEPDESSIPTPDNISTCLDLQSLDAHYSRKMRDDSRVHHILEDVAFMPRKRSGRHQRQMVPESASQPLFHHQNRLHLRRLLSYVDQPSTGSDAEQIIINVPVVDVGKPRKNVSFADSPGNAKSDDPDSTVAEVSTENSDSEDDGGIVFTAPTSGGDEELLMSSLQTFPTAVEISLPWKRNTGRDPVSSSFTHCLADDNLPQIGEAPSWLQNDSVSPAMSDHVDLLNSCDNSDADKSNVSKCCESYPCGSSVVNTEEVEGNKASCQTIQPDTYSLPFPWLHTEEQLLTENEHTDPPVRNMDTKDSSFTNCDEYSCPTSPAKDSKLGYMASDIKDEEGCTCYLVIPQYSEHTGANAISLGTTEKQSLLQLSNEAYRTNADFMLPSQHFKSCPQFFRLEPDVNDGIPPPPWRHNSDVEVSLDCHAPRSCFNHNNGHGTPHNSCVLPPWRQLCGSDGAESLLLKSASCSHEVDVFSIRPQHSTHSFRISEGESKHSEAYQIHHVIDLVHGRPTTNTDLENIAELDLDTEQEDYQERVTKWLLANESFMGEPSMDEEVNSVYDWESERKHLLSEVKED